MHVFETRTQPEVSGFPFLTCLHTTAFALPSIFFPLEMLGIKIWKTPLFWRAKCPLPVDVRVSKTCTLKLPISRAPQESPSQKMQKVGSWSQPFHTWTVETGDESSLFVSAVFCEEFFGKNRALYVDVTYKDDNRFRKGSVHEL